ncbi:hypothetical protein CsatA_014427 [Cannabis sativa]
MDVVEAWLVVSSNISKALTYYSQEIESSAPDLQKEFSSLGEAVLTIFKSKDLNAFEKQLKFVELIKQALSLKKRVDEFDDKCLNYNLPLFLGDGEHEDDQSFKNYLRYLHKFMKYWKREAEKRREDGGKSLIERLDESEKKNAFEYIKMSLIFVGSYLSDLISEFILVIVILGDRNEIMKNLEDFKAMIKLLSLDNDEKNSNSIVIKRKLLSDDGDIEFELLRMILKEVLSLEVVFCCPKMTEVLTDNPYILHGSSLHKYFTDRLMALDLKMNELRAQTYLLPPINEETKKKLKVLIQTIDDGYQNIWKKLDLNSTSAAAASSS